MPSILSNLIAFARHGSRYVRESRGVSFEERVEIRKRLTLKLLNGFGIELTCPDRAAFESNGPSIYVLNHASLLDALFIFGFFQIDIRILAKDGAFYAPVLGKILKIDRHIRVHRGRRSHERNNAIRNDIHTALQEGASIAIFPEGTRTSTGALGQFKLGAFYNAVQNGVHVVPVVIRGTFAALPKTTLRVRPGKCSVELLPPVELPDESMGDEATRVRWLAQQTREAMLDALNRDNV